MGVRHRRSGVEGHAGPADRRQPAADRRYPARLRRTSGGLQWQACSLTCARLPRSSRVSRRGRNARRPCPVADLGSRAAAVHGPHLANLPGQGRGELRVCEDRQPGAGLRGSGAPAGRQDGGGKARARRLSHREVRLRPARRRVRQRQPGDPLLPRARRAGDGAAHRREGELLPQARAAGTGRERPGRAGRPWICRAGRWKRCASPSARTRTTRCRRAFRPSSARSTPSRCPSRSPEWCTRCAPRCATGAHRRMPPPLVVERLVYTGTKP